MTITILVSPLYNCNISFTKSKSTDGPDSSDGSVDPNGPEGSTNPAGPDALVALATLTIKTIPESSLKGTFYISVKTPPIPTIVP